MPKAKPYSGPVKKDIIVSLLNSTGETVDGELLGNALMEAASRLADLVDKSNDALEESEFTNIVAGHLAAELNRRGHPQIWVSETGDAFLDISYGKRPSKRRKSNRRIPLLDELKARAKSMGVDISHLGIKRKQIRDYLDAVEAGEEDPKKVKAEAPKAKVKKQVPKKAVPKVQVAEDEPDEDTGPMSAGPDETKTSPMPDDPKPPKRSGFVKTGEAISGPVVVDSPKNGTSKSANGASGNRRSLSQLQQDAEELDVASLIASEPPK